MLRVRPPIHQKEIQTDLDAAEFEVTEERLGTYRPEEHIDNPKDYADNQDARQYDTRLRPPVQPIELQVDPQTGMKNYIANENLGIATSSGYIKHSFSRSIHFGRLYTSGSHSTKGKEADLCEALRCLGQGLHCLEDFGAHTNYTELALREIGFRNVFPHTGTATEISLRGKHVFPLVTGTFGAVDFLHSVVGEATDNLAQTEIDEMDIALGDAQTHSKQSSAPASRNFGPPSQTQASALTGLLSQVPGAGALCQEAEQLQAQSQAQERMLASQHNYGDSRSSQPGQTQTFQAPPGSVGGPPGPGIPGMSPNFDPAKTAAQIYPILEFRDKVVKAISATIEKIPGLEALVEKITETLTLFVLSLLAPFIRPIITAVSKQLKMGSSTVVDASGKHQYEVWTDPHCSDPTHSLLSKDHFSNVLNEPAGQVAATILQYVAPRILFAWEHPDVPLDEVLNDVARVFHHPANRDPHCDLHTKMFNVVEQWAHKQPNRGANLEHILSSEGVRAGKNHSGGSYDPVHAPHNHGSLPQMGNIFGSGGGTGSHSKVAGAPWEKLSKLGKATGLTRDGIDESGHGNTNTIGSIFPGTSTSFDATRPPTGPANEYQYGQPQFEHAPYSQHESSYQQDTYNQSAYASPPPPDQNHNTYGAPPPQVYGQDYGQQQQGYGQGTSEGYPQHGYPQHGYGYDASSQAPSYQPEQNLGQHGPGAYAYGYEQPPQGQGGYHGASGTGGY